jgi:hypothetical protein
MNRKKAQHEIIGFVLIIVIISVIGIFFLSFSGGKESNINSLEVVKLLESSMLYTSDCAIGYIPQYKEIQDLIKECYRNDITKCINGKKVCENLNDEFKNILRLAIIKPIKQEFMILMKNY